VHGLGLRFGSRQIFDNLTFISPAASGYRCWGQRRRKTSLLRIIAGLAKATAGEVRASDGQPIDGGWRGWGRKICSIRG
jgi:putative hydroxymethylpyrimidine transport system ATP-binding protein